MKLNQATVDLVKQFEGLELASYLDPVGVLTIGYGYTNQAGYGPGVKSGDVWTEDQADRMLIEGLEKFGQRIIPMFKRKPTSNQYGAMLSLAYNIGTGAFRKSTCLRRFNAGDFEGAAEALTWFNKAGGRKLRGLVRRREAERDLFLSEPATLTAARPDPERGPSKSRTIIGAVTAGTGTTGTATLDLVKDVQSEVGGLMYYADTLKWVFVALAIAGIGLTIYARIDDMRKGNR